MRRAALDPVDVERRLGERPQVELLRGARRRPGLRPGAASSPAPDGSSAQPASSSSVGGTMPLRSGSGSLPSRATTPRDRRRQRVRRVQRRAAEEPRMQVALARPERHVEVDEPARRERERRSRPRRTMSVSKITAASAPRSSAARKSTIEWPPISSSPSQQNADVDGQLAGPRQLPGAREEHVELPLVVHRAARRRGTRRGSPARTGRSPRARAAPAAARRSGRRGSRSARLPPCDARTSPIASGWPCQSITSASPPMPRTKSVDPPRSAVNIGGVRRVGADRGDSEKLGQLVEPGTAHMPTFGWTLIARV